MNLGMFFEPNWLGKFTAKQSPSRIPTNNYTNFNFFLHYPIIFAVS